MESSIGRGKIRRGLDVSIDGKNHERTYENTTPEFKALIQNTYGSFVQKNSRDHFPPYCDTLVCALLETKIYVYVHQGMEST